MRVGAKEPEIVLRNGKPAAVIIDIDAYQELLERVEDAADVKRLEKMRKGRLSFKTLDAFLTAGRKRV
jgi:PHD/YefM family antitoxin component YafN of YafNO toxin-antitoxin module